MKTTGHLTAKMAETSLTWKHNTSAHLLPVTAINLCIAPIECLFLSHMTSCEPSKNELIVKICP